MCPKKDDKKVETTYAQRRLVGGSTLGKAGLDILGKKNPGPSSRAREAAGTAEKKHLAVPPLKMGDAQKFNPNTPRPGTPRIPKDRKEIKPTVVANKPLNQVQETLFTKKDRTQAERKIPAFEDIKLKVSDFEDDLGSSRSFSKSPRTKR